APTPGQPVKAALHIPIAVGLVGPDGLDRPLRVSEAHDSVMQRLEARRGETGTHTVVLDLTRSRQVFVFDDIDAEPVPSLARNLSAPVVVDCRYSDEALALLAAHDSDPFNRWEAAQRFIVERVVAIVDGAHVD